MKNMLLLTLAAACFLFVACEEEPPYINYTPNTVTYETTFVDVAGLPAPQLREVLVEDISGVRCVNCPDAAVIIKRLKADFAGRVNSITIYPNTSSLNSLTLPVNKPDKGFVSKYDLRTDAGGQMLATLGTPNSLPNGYVNRKLFAGKTDRFIDRTEWADKVTSENDSVIPVNIYVRTSYGADGKLNADLELRFTEDLSGDYYISMALIQDSIIDVQETTDPNIGATYIADYPHMHVLRKMFTSNLGDKINATPNITLVKGRVVEKRYSLELTPEAGKAPYDKKHLGIVAFVHRGGDNVVVQSKEFEVAE